MRRRGLLLGLLAAPAIIRMPGLLMPIAPPPLKSKLVGYLPDLLCEGPINGIAEGQPIPILFMPRATIYVNDRPICTTELMISMSPKSGRAASS